MLSPSDDNTVNAKECWIVSSDGYPYGYFNEKNDPAWPNFRANGIGEGVLCKIDYQRCFDWPGIGSASEFLTHIAFRENVACGDCSEQLILAL